MPKDKVVFDKNGESGNIYAILGQAQLILRKERRINDFNEMRDRVYESHSYEDALNVIGKYVELEDISK